MKKSAIILIAVILILAIGAASTIAWFTSVKSLTNTFTVGKVDITLTEPDWVSANDNLLVPGKALTKDPTVTVLAGSEKCYVFVKIETAADLETVIDYTVITVNPRAWVPLDGYPGVYWQITEKSASATVIPVLTGNQVNVPTTIVAADLALVQTADDTMKITAYAIQFDYLSDAGTPVSDAVGAWNILT